MSTVRLSILLCASLYVAPSYAAFVLDDFNDSAEVVSPASSPEMQNEFLETEGVGPLNATRSIRIFYGQGNPDGTLDAHISKPSVLTGQITNLNPLPFGDTLVSIQSNYDFPGTDFTEGGMNNAFFFDFSQLTSEIPPSLFKILLEDGNSFFLYFEAPFPLNPNPFTLVVPFDSFTFRDGQPGLPDYTTISAVNLEIRASLISGGGPDPLNFFVELDRIRVGRIPEPASFVLMLCSLFVSVHRRTSRSIERRL